jgi:hypothetical protein
LNGLILATVAAAAGAATHVLLTEHLNQKKLREEAANAEAAAKLALANLFYEFCECLATPSGTYGSRPIQEEITGYKLLQMSNDEEFKTVVAALMHNKTSKMLDKFRNSDGNLQLVNLKIHFDLFGKKDLE